MGLIVARVAVMRIMGRPLLTITSALGARDVTGLIPEQLNL